MRVLIIGGTGIISTGITRLLVERGDDVVLYNRGRRASLVEGNYTTIIGNRKDFATFEKQMEEAGTFDCVIDMFCFQPEEAQNTVRAFKSRTGQYIFCSTVDVYTKPAASYPITEAAECLPSSKFSYAYNKARCEELLFAAHERRDLVVTSIRPGHTYGGLLREDLSPKPAYNALQGLIHSDWHTDVDGRTDERGIIRFRVFMVPSRAMAWTPFWTAPEYDGVYQSPRDFSLPRFLEHPIRTLAV